MNLLQRRTLTAVVLCSLTLGGCGAPSFVITPTFRTDEIEEVQVRKSRSRGSDKIVVIPVEGIIANARGAGLLGSGENMVDRFSQELERAELDSRVKAVVLRINSPGGTVTASDTLYDMIVSFRKRTGKPVIASVQEVGASGGFYVACAADQIVAQPTSVVGSIGVIFQTVSVEAALSRWGIKTEAIKSGELKDMGSPLHDLTDNERKVFQGLVDEYYSRFTKIVVTSNPQTDVLKLDGRVMSGSQALQAKMIDTVGSLEDAIQIAQEKSNTKNAKVILYRRPYGPGGSIYASTHVVPAQAGTELKLPVELPQMSSGFYYLWKP